MQPVRRTRDRRWRDGSETLYRTFDRSIRQNRPHALSRPRHRLRFLPGRLCCGCTFCATGLGGLTRNLTVGEMVSTDHRRRPPRPATRPLPDEPRHDGDGRTVHNYDATMKLVAILNEPHGLNLGARRITISTSRDRPMIDKLATSPTRSTSPSPSTLRTMTCGRLVPINRRYPIAD